MPTEVAELTDAPVEVGGVEQDSNANVLLDPREQARIELAATICATPEEIRVFRPQLRALVDKAIAATGDPQEQRALRMYLGVREYVLFGQPGEPLPPGYVFTGKSRLNTQGQYDVRAGYCYHCNSEAGSKVDEDINDKIIESRKARADEITEKAATYIKLTPAYRMLQNVSLEVPIPPPNPHARQMKLNALLEKVEHDNLAKITDMTPAGFRARDQYNRGIMAIDLEEEMERHDQTRASKGTRGNSALLAKARLTQLTKTSLGVSGDARFEVAEKYSAGSYGSYVFRLGHKEESPHNFGSSTLLELGIIDDASLLERAVSLNLFGELYSVLFDPDFRGTYQQALQQAVEKAAERFTDRELNPFKQYIPDHMLRMPPNEIVSEEDLIALRDEHEDWHRQIEQARDKQTRVEFVSREEQERRDKNIIGHIVVADPGATEPHLIQSTDTLPPADFATDNAHEVLVISLNPKELSGTPHIPGYRLTSARRGSDSITYGFEKDPAGTPYTRANIVIPEDVKLELADKYEEIGLHVLADSLRASANMTVAELATMVQGETYYPSVKSSKRGSLPSAFVPRSLDDFKVIVKNKQLWAQCNGSGPFTALSLQYLGLDAGTTTGNVFSPNGRVIKEAPHMQTYLNYNGRRYILDTTGRLTAAQKLRASATSLGRKVTDNLKSLRRIGRRTQAPPAAHAPEIIPVPEAIPQVVTATEKRQTAEERLRSISDNLRISLAPLFGASTPAGLMKALGARDVRRSLAINDPIDRTISVASRAKEGNVTDDELALLAGFVRNYLKHRTTNDNKGRPNYEQATLDILSDTILQIRLAMAGRQLR